MRNRQKVANSKTGDFLIDRNATKKNPKEDRVPWCKRIEQSDSKLYSLHDYYYCTK